jgi:WD40 repeat protein
VSAPAVPKVAAMTPYKGLASFEDSDVDATLFFGRDREQEIIAANLTAARLTLLYGPSGVGKSSVLRAGVARRLRELPGPLAVVVFDRWRDEPGARLREAVSAAVGGDFAGSLADTLEAATARLGGELYVILDGAEEYFVYHGDESEPGTFAADFPDAVTRDGLQAYFLLSLRDDSLAALDRFKTRIPNLFANALRLEYLDRSAAREAIVGPLDEFNKLTSESPVEIEPELVEAVLDQVARGNVDLGRAGRGVAHSGAPAQAVETPFLSLVMERIWEAERSEGSELLRLQTFERLGGAEQIVRDHLDDALDGLTPEGQAATAEMFNYLVTPSGTKIAHRASDLARYADVRESELEPTLGVLTSERILRPVAAADGSTRYEIFHDVLAGAVLAWRTRHRSERELEAERSRASRRQRRTAFAAAVAAAVIAVLTAATVYALVERSRARTGARRAEAGELVAQARAELAARPVRSVELAVRAARLEPSRQTAETLRASLRGLYLDAQFRMGAPVATVDFSRYGRFLVAAAGDEARIIRVRDHQVMRRLKHGAPITGAWFDPNLRFVLTTGDDGVARAWDVATGHPLYSVRHDRRINSATFSPDGSLFATASDDRTVRVWRPSDGRRLQLLKHPRLVDTVSFNHAGTLLATSGKTDRFARVFDVATGRLVNKLDQGGWVADVAFAPRGVRLATAGADKTARIWNARTGEQLLVLEGHGSRVLDVEFDAKGDRLVTASADQTARIWDAHNGDLLAKLFGETDRVYRAHFSPDGEAIVTASRDRAARVFHEEGRVQNTLAGHTDAVTDAIFDRDGNKVATAGRDGSVRLWSWRTRPYMKTVVVHRGPVVAEQFTPDAHRLVSVGSDGRVAVWPVGGGSVAWFGTPSPTVSATIGAHSVVIVSFDGTTRVWQFDGRLLRTFRGPTRIVLAAVGPNGRFVATADARGVVRLRDVGTGRVLDTADVDARLTQLTFSGDGRHLLATGRDGVARLWRIGDGRLQAEHELRGHRKAIAPAAFSPDGRRIVTAGIDHTARTWTVASGKPEHELVGHRKALTSATFSHDGRRLATTAEDQDARLWAVATGRPLYVLSGHFGSVNDTAFTADDRWIVSAGGGGAKVFDTTTGQALYFPSTHDTLPLKVATSPTGWRIAVGGKDGLVETFDCRLCGDLQQLLADASKKLRQVRARP